MCVLVDSHSAKSRELTVYEVCMVQKSMMRGRVFHRFSFSKAVPYLRRPSRAEIDRNGRLDASHLPSGLLLKAYSSLVLCIMTNRVCTPGLSVQKRASRANRSISSTQRPSLCQSRLDSIITSPSTHSLTHITSSPCYPPTPPPS